MTRRKRSTSVKRERVWLVYVNPEHHDAGDRVWLPRHGIHVINRVPWLVAPDFARDLIDAYSQIHFATHADFESAGIPVPDETAEAPTAPAEQEA